jgi:hypothetical protein
MVTDRDIVCKGLAADAFARGEDTGSWGDGLDQSNPFQTE